MMSHFRVELERTSNEEFARDITMTPRHSANPFVNVPPPGSRVDHGGRAAARLQVVGGCGLPSQAGLSPAGTSPWLQESPDQNDSRIASPVDRCRFFGGNMLRLVS